MLKGARGVAGHIWTVRELSDRLGQTKAILLRRARDEHWAESESSSRDPRTKAFAFSALPGDIQLALRRGILIRDIPMARRKQLCQSPLGVDAIDRRIEAARKRLAALLRQRANLVERSVQGRASAA